MKGLSKAERHEVRRYVRHSEHITELDLFRAPAFVGWLMAAEMRKRGFFGRGLRPAECIYQNPRVRDAHHHLG